MCKGLTELHQLERVTQVIKLHVVLLAIAQLTFNCALVLNWAENSLIM